MSAQQDEAWFAAIEHGDVETVRSYSAVMSKVTDEQGVTSLMKAATKGNVTIIQLLLADGVKRRDRWGRTALMFAAMSGCAVAVEILIPHEATLTDSDGMTGLMYAAFHGNVDIVRLLLPQERGYATRHESVLQLGTQTYEIGVSVTALMISVLTKHAECVELLVDSEAGKVDCKGETALYKAVASNFLPAVKVLAALEAEHRTISGQSPIYLAVKTGFLDAIECLIEYEDDDKRYGHAKETVLMVAVAQRDARAVSILAPTLHSEFSKEGMTALILAAQDNLIEICSILIPYEFGLTTHHGKKTALMFAAEMGNVECVRLLVDKEAGMRTDAGETALMLAARRGQIECVTELIPYEKCAISKNYHTALMLAVMNDHISLASLLVEHEQRIQNEKGQTSLMLAVLRRNAPLVTVLAPYEAGVFDAQHQTALILATIDNEYDLVEILINYEACLADCDARTSLMLAAEKNYVNLIPLLCEKEFGRLDRFGRSALFIAAQNGNVHIVKELVCKEKKMITTRRFRVEHNTQIYIELGSTALIYATLYDKLEIVQLLAAHESGLLDNTGHCALHYAIRRKNADLTRVLLQYEYFITDKNGNTPLMLLIKTGMDQFIPGLVQRLLGEAHQDTNSIIACNNNGDTALSIALTHKSYLAVCALYGNPQLSFQFYDSTGASLLEQCEAVGDDSMMQVFLTYFVAKLVFSSSLVSTFYHRLSSFLLDEYIDGEDRNFILHFLDCLFNYTFINDLDCIHLHNPLNSPGFEEISTMISEQIDIQEGVCNICYGDLAVVLCFPCKHVVTCKSCWKKLDNTRHKRDVLRCPVCRETISYNIVLTQLDDCILSQKGKYNTSSLHLQNATELVSKRSLATQIELEEDGGTSNTLTYQLIPTYASVSSAPSGQIICQNILQYTDTESFAEIDESSEAPELADLYENREDTAWNEDIDNIEVEAFYK
ncbi:Protein 21.1 [Giardia lamblia P15]|uniref:Protein 21.1 n=1 Tax=Giardia intestinalis (strain P15) TaxID=658858 RepID=E1F7Z5_GIAIA|nr:Protein 21.1 [Giardia lamblia P15]